MTVFVMRDDNKTPPKHVEADTDVVSGRGFNSPRLHLYKPRAFRSAGLSFFCIGTRSSCPRLGPMIQCTNVSKRSIDMVKKLTKHGNSYALVIDKPIMDILNITDDTPLNITTDGCS